MPFSQSLYRRIGPDILEFTGKGLIGMSNNAILIIDDIGKTGLPQSGNADLPTETFQMHGKHTNPRDTSAFILNRHGYYQNGLAGRFTDDALEGHRDACFSLLKP